LISEDSARQLTTMVTPMPIGNAPPGLPALATPFRGYALGFEVRDYRGHKIVLHTGGLPGYVSRVAMIPDADVGVAVLTNQESDEAFDSIAWHVLDHYLAAPAFDWIDGYARVRARTADRVAAEEKKIPAARDAGARPSLPLDKYAGLYRDPWYGDIAISYSSGQLTMAFSHTPALTGTLEPFQHDTFVARWRDRELRADAYVTFALNPDGSIEQAKMQAVSPATDFSYDFQDLALRPVRTR
jgi:hypothetical protein